MKKFLELTWTDNDNFQHKEIINVNNIEKLYIALPDETEISVSENVNGKRRKFSMCFEDKGKCFSEFRRICIALCGGFYDRPMPILRLWPQDAGQMRVLPPAGIHAGREKPVLGPFRRCGEEDHEAKKL